MDEKKETRAEEVLKKPYKKPQITTEEIYARPAHCAKCESPTGPIQDAGCFLFGDPSTS